MPDGSEQPAATDQPRASGSIRLRVGSLLFLAALGMWLLVWQGVLPIWRLHCDSATLVQCGRRIHAIGQALRMYSLDHDGFLPRAAVWTSAIEPYSYMLNEGLRCPTNVSSGKTTYAFNANLSARKLNTVADPGRTVLVYETSRGGSNPAGIGHDMPSPALHPHPRVGAKERVNWVVTVDGKPHNSMEAEFDLLHW